MSGLFGAARVNILYGAVALIPVAALLLVAYYLFGFWQSVLKPISRWFGLDTLDSQLVAVSLATMGLLAICFILGLLIRTQFGTWTFEKVENRILSNIPGYGILSTLLRGFADDRHAYPAAMVTLTPGGAGTLAFIMEDNGQSHLTVFVPSAPMMTVGQIYAVPRSDVEILPGVSIEAANAVSQWGVGLQPSVAQGRQTAQEAAAKAAKTDAPSPPGT
ncbi:MAG: DUF502 domain-containing protein [Hyphomicrobiaceae bacterium]